MENSVQHFAFQLNRGCRRRCGVAADAEAIEEKTRSHFGDENNSKPNLAANKPTEQLSSILF